MEQLVKNHLFCFGLGYTGSALAHSLQEKGWKISGTSRESDVVATLNAKGYAVYQFDGKQPLPATIFDDVTHVLLSIPPGEDGDLVFNLHHGFFSTAANSLKWVGYLSTTGVYGDRQGGWVDETSDLTPSTKRGEKRLLAENQWLCLYQKHKLPVHLFRLAGIYGPGNNQLEKIANGTARRRIKPGQVFSRIHVDDIVGMLNASIQNPNPGTAYNLCDDEAAPPQDVVKYAAELMGIDPPPEIPFNIKDMTPMGLSFFAESKRVSNTKIKTELGYKLKYPTYREGLRDLVASVSKFK